MKHLSQIIALALTVAIVNVSSASAYYGGWLHNNNVGGAEILNLGDSEDGLYFHLRGTSYFCGSPGASYAKMRNVMNRNYGEYINWWISNDCGDYARICIENVRGENACSTYRVEGWRRSKR